MSEAKFNCFFIQFFYHSGQSSFISNAQQLKEKNKNKNLLSGKKDKY